MTPLILVTNDDGVFAPGIAALAEALEGLGEIAVIAPDRDSSAVSHMITLHSALRVVQVRPGWWAVQGTPTDCVYLGAIELLGRLPHLVISGINAGPNLGFDVHYSGTVSAAIEGTLLGIPSIAVSLTEPRDSSLLPASRFARTLAEAVLTLGGLPRGMTLNVNVPGGEPREHQRTFLGRRQYSHQVHRRIDPRGRPYYWIGGDPAHTEDVEGSDCTAVARGVISVTPLAIDMTDLASVKKGIDGLELKGFDEVPAVAPPPGFLPFIDR